MVILITIVAVSVLQAAAAQSNTCQTCNCQLNNVQVLEQLIDYITKEKVSRILASQSTPGNIAIVNCGIHSYYIYNNISCN